MPGKRTRAERRKKKMAQRKMAKRLRYEALRGTPGNKKDKRRQRKAGGAFNPHDHPNGHCGNPGCRKCYPKLAETGDRYMRRWRYKVEDQRLSV